MLLMNSRLMNSPIEPVFAGVTDIPFAFREQFLLTPESPHDVLLTGEMEAITFPLLLTPLIKAFGRFGMLVPTPQWPGARDVALHRTSPGGRHSSPRMESNIRVRRSNPI